MKRLVALVALATAATIVACDSGGPLAPPVSYPFAVAARTCGPADGPAFEVYLSKKPITLNSPDYPFVSVFVWTSAEDAVGKIIDLAQTTDGHAAYRLSNDPHSSLSGVGTITVTSVKSAGSVIEGDVDLMFPGQDRILGGFTATLAPQSFVCG